MEQIDEDRKTEQGDDTDEMNDRFHLATDGLFANPFDNAKNHFATVERRNRQEVEYGEVHADKRRDIEEGQQPARRRVRRY